MRCWIVFLAIIVVLMPLAGADEIMENVRPGPITLELGEGYEASFVLSDIESMYDIEIVTPSKSSISEKYEFVIYRADESEILADVAFWVYSWEGPYPKRLCLEI